MFDNFSTQQQFILMMLMSDYAREKPSSSNYMISETGFRLISESGSHIKTEGSNA
jgi:hypothetical protein